MSKGSKRRNQLVSDKQVEDNWKRTFGKKKKKKKIEKLDISLKNDEKTYEYSIKE